MNKKFFKKALPVFIDSKQKNTNVIFVIKFSGSLPCKLKITGKNEYQIFLNNKFISFGPARAAKNYHRVDEISFSNLLDKNILIIKVSNPNVYSFEFIKEEGFIQYEIIRNNRIIKFSSLNDKCYLNIGRYQKVSRFSYQRCFSESYNNKLAHSNIDLDTIKKYPRLKLQVKKYGEYLSRNVSFPLLEEENTSKILQGEIVRKNNRLPIYKNRYQFKTEIGLFPIDEYEIDPNKIISQLTYFKKDKISSNLTNREASLYDFNKDLTGFIRFNIDVFKYSKVYLIFDEISSEKEGFININPFRNSSHNIISFEFKKGHYEFISSHPYSLRFLKVICYEGNIDVNDVGIVKLENPDVKIKLNSGNKDLDQIFLAATNSFKTNGIDILTDCPSRERGGYMCDSYFTSLAESFLTKDNKVEYNLFENYALENGTVGVPNKMVPMCYPSEFGEPLFIPNWAMFYVIELKRFKNTKLLNQSLQKIRNLISYFKDFENKDHLLEDLPGWVFVEWSKVNEHDSLKGVNVATNALYYQFLMSAGELLKQKSLINKANKIKGYILNTTINKNGFFVDNLIRNDKKKLVLNNRVSETTQYYVYYFLNLDKEKYKILYLNLKDKCGPNNDVTKLNIFPSNAFIGYYLRLSILVDNKEYDLAKQEILKYFTKMAYLTSTLWENNSESGSLNHGFTSYTSVLINRIINKI